VNLTPGSLHKHTRPRANPQPPDSQPNALTDSASGRRPVRAHKAGPA
jgi:hypothetical protein